MINTPAPTKEIEKIQLVKAHLEENRVIPKRFTIIGRKNGGEHPISEAPQGGVDISYKEFIQSDPRCRTAKSNKTSDWEGASIKQSGSDMQMFTHPQEGASSCGTDTIQSDQCMQIHIPQVQIGNLCGKNNNQSKQDMQMHNSPREGGKPCGENCNQSDSSNFNLFTTTPFLTSSPREGVVTKSNQSEARELYSSKNIQISLSPTLNLNINSSNKFIINSTKQNFQRKMSKFILPSIKQTINPIEERNRAETRQTVEMITESRKRKRINIVSKNKMHYARMLANFRTNRMKRTVRVNMIADKVGKKKEQEAPVNTNKKSFTTGLHNILDADLLGELTTEDS